jgi:hypothetical protein
LCDYNSLHWVLSGVHAAWALQVTLSCSQQKCLLLGPIPILQLHTVPRLRACRVGMQGMQNHQSTVQAYQFTIAFSGPLKLSQPGLTCNAGGFEAVERGSRSLPEAPDRRVTRSSVALKSTGQQGPGQLSTGQLARLTFFPWTPSPMPHSTGGSDHTQTTTFIPYIECGPSPSPFLSYICVRGAPRQENTSRD